MIKVAVCMFGQPRTWAKCASWIKQTFTSTNQMEIDFFCELKNFNSNKHTGELQVLGNTEITALLRMFQPKASIVTTQEYEGNGPYSSMYLSMFKSLLLKQQYEQATGVQYDVTVLHRYDLLVGPNPNWFIYNFAQPIDPGHLYANGSNVLFHPEAFKMGMGDFIIIGNSLALDILGGKLLGNFNIGSDHLRAFDSNLLSPNVALAKHAQDSGFAIHDLSQKRVLVRDSMRVPKDITKGWTDLEAQYYKELSTMISWRTS